MRATLDNVTGLPVEETVEWALERTGVDSDDLVIWVSRTGHPCHHGWLRVRETSLLVRARIPLVYPYVTHRKEMRDTPRYEVRSWDESLVCILAHEFSHVLQLRRGPLTKDYVRRPASPHYRTTSSGKVVLIVPKQENVKVRGRMFDELEAEWSEHLLLHIYREEHP